MLSLISTLGGLLISGLPSVLGFFQDKSDKAHELKLAQMQTEREMAMMAAGYAAQAKMEEIRTDQVEMQTAAQMQNAALDHDKKVMERASTWVVNYVGTVRPTVTYLFVLELVAINAWLSWNLFKMPGLITSVNDLTVIGELIFSSDEMAMLGGIIGFWFGSRNWDKKK
jgi:hypothetical protein